MYRCYVAVLTILFCEYTTALVNHKPPIIHTNHPYLNIKENSRVEVLTTGLVIPSGNKNSTSSGIDPVVVNKLIIDTRIEILYLRQTRVSSTKDSSVTLESKTFKKAKQITKLKSIEDHKFQNILPNTGTEFVIIDASSQTNDEVTVTTHDNATASRVFLFPTRLGINSTYRVALKKIPDREVERTWYLTFQAHDNHGDTLWTLPLHIDDVNDNAPFFEHDHYHSVVGYGLAVGSKIVHVTAIDSDEGPNAAITYSMSPYQVPSPSSRYNAFVIDPITGDITLKEDLQHGHTTYHYQVNATDNGVPKQSSSTLVNIEIFDFNALG